MCPYISCGAGEDLVSQAVQPVLLSDKRVVCSSSYCRYLQEMWIYIKSASVQGVCAARRAQQGTTQVFFLCSVVLQSRQFVRHSGLMATSLNSTSLGLFQAL